MRLGSTCTCTCRSTGYLYLNAAHGARRGLACLLLCCLAGAIHHVLLVLVLVLVLVLLLLSELRASARCCLLLYLTRSYFRLSKWRNSCSNLLPPPQSYPLGPVCRCDRCSGLIASRPVHVGVSEKVGVEVGSAPLSSPLNRKSFSSHNVMNPLRSTSM